MPLMKGLNGGVKWASRREDGNLPPEQVRMTMADFKDQLEERRKLVDGKATQYRTTRDEWNDKTKTHTTTRNELNAEVRELIVQVREQREIREQMNEIVREKKSARSTASDAVKAAKLALDNAKGPAAPAPREQQQGGKKKWEKRPATVHSLRKDLHRLENEFEQGRHTGKNEIKVMKRMKDISAQIKKLKNAEDENSDLKDSRAAVQEAMAEQEIAHEEVQKAATAAQEAHELMLQWNSEVDRQRELAETAHRGLRRSKKEADKAHHFYIVSLRCLHSIQDMLRAMRGASAGAGQKQTARVEVQDLMGKLMSGQTLSTEELMQLQSNE
ncbi:MAG: hypothetical protein NZ736_00105 [Candidatus Poseidoniaceae archaeon]|nr:hypothetical protein [Candidatus Poseidoniaceae archaeon]